MVFGVDNAIFYVEEAEDARGIAERCNTMDDLISYLEQIAEPTLADFKSNPTSERHAFLACVATYHAIDRLTNRPGNTRKKWRDQSLAFLIVDMVAHHLKHVRCDQENSDRTCPGR